MAQNTERDATRNATMAAILQNSVIATTAATSMVASMQSQGQLNHSSPTVGSFSLAEEPKMAEVEMYDDKAKELRRWLNAYSNFFASQPTRFPTHESKIGHLSSRFTFRSHALRWATSLLDQHVDVRPPWLVNFNYARFTEELQLYQGVSALTGQARDRLLALKQTHSVSG